MANESTNNGKTLPPTPWRETSLYQHLYEVNEEGYRAMLEYEKAGGVLDVREKSAKKYYEIYLKRHKKKANKSLKEKFAEDMVKDISGDVEINDSWEDE